MVRTSDSTALLFASMLAAALTLATATNSFAARGGTGGGGMSGMNGHFGGNSASHISAQGLAHTNGPNAADRDFGRERAADVRNSHAQSHSMSGMHMHGARMNAHHSTRHVSISKWDTLTSL